MIVPVAERSTQDSIVINIEERISTCEFIEKTIDSALQEADALR